MLTKYSRAESRLVAFQYDEMFYHASVNVDYHYDDFNNPTIDELYIHFITDFDGNAVLETKELEQAITDRLYETL